MEVEEVVKEKVEVEEEEVEEEEEEAGNTLLMSMTFLGSFEH